MGQAKKNGKTFEERKAKAIERDRLKEEALQAKWKAEWDAMTPEQQKEYRDNRRKQKESVATVMSLANMLNRGSW
jgi:hypothetical protein